MVMKTAVRRFAKAAFLTSERYPDLKRGPYGVLTSSHVAAFERILDPARVLTNEDDVAPYNLDWLKTVNGQSKVVVRPKTTEELSAVMKICSEHGLAVCPQGGNTGLVGGSVPVFDEVVISTSLMNKVNFVDGVSGTVSCQAGVVLEKLESELEAEGLMAPYDLGARGSCQVGGNISTCAGGLRLLRYGSMNANTLGLEAVLADGSVLNMMNSLKKDNTGYHLRQLFIGSEGTLGVVTQAILQCPVRPRSVNLALLSLKNFNDVLSTFALAKRCLSEILSSCEMMDAICINSVRQKLGITCPLNYDSNTFFMVIESHGSVEEHDAEKMSLFVQEAMDKGLVTDGVTTSEPSRMANLWQLRERITESLAKDDYVFKYDITLPLPKFYEAVEVLKKKLEPFGENVVTSGFGHIGDGNLHLNVTAPEYSERLFHAIEPFVFEWTSQAGGSISAEHGMGFKKAKFLKYSKSPEAIRIMRNIKNSMDPQGILNPYKVLPPS